MMEKNHHAVVDLAQVKGAMTIQVVQLSSVVGAMNPSRK